MTTATLSDQEATRRALLRGAVLDDVEAAQDGLGRLSAAAAGLKCQVTAAEPDAATLAALLARAHRLRREVETLEVDVAR
jgi:hypothetical protein